MDSDSSERHRDDRITASEEPLARDRHPSTLLAGVRKDTCNVTLLQVRPDAGAGDHSPSVGVEHNVLVAGSGLVVNDKLDVCVVRLDYRLRAKIAEHDPIKARSASEQVASLNHDFSVKLAACGDDRAYKTFGNVDPPVSSTEYRAAVRENVNVAKSCAGVLGNHHDGVLAT